MLYIASDHAGFKLKEEVKIFLERKGIEVTDIGPEEYVEDDDYPDYVIPTMHEVQKSPENMAIIICKNGVGVSMLANKFRGIRCVLSWRPDHAKSSREDDATNVLALPAGYLTREDALDVVHGWLTGTFTAEPRHIRRLKKISNLES